MLPSKDFTTFSEHPPFDLKFEDLIVDGKSNGRVTIPVHFSPEGRMYVRLEKSLEATTAQLFDLMNKSVQVRYSKKAPPQNLIITKQNYTSDTDRTSVEAIFATEPVILDEGRAATSIEAVLVNSPGLITAPIPLVSHAGTSFRIEPSSSKAGATSVLKSDIPLRVDDPLAPLSDLISFLTFTKGSYWSLGNVVASDKEGKVSFRLLGFSKLDNEKRETNWFDIEVQNQLPEIFKLFSATRADNLARKALSQAINFYRAANASRKISIEMSIIAAHTALEAIVNFILAYRAGWSKSLSNQRTIPFSDKARAAFWHFGPVHDLLLNSPELSKFVAGRDGMDAFGAISFFRNKLVHQDDKLAPTGIQLHEVWQLTQWMVEVLILGVIGYQGKLIDRRLYGPNAWRGTTCEMPWATHAKH